MLSKKKTKNTLPLTLSDDLITEILLRLPVRSLLRFKCVCKSWLYLISDPQFAKSHFDLAIVPTHRVLLRSIENSKVDSIEVETPLRKHSSEVVFNIPPPLMYGCKVGIVGSCRGFLLLTNYVYYDQVCDFVIWNPSTNLRKQIRNVARWSFHHAQLYGIGYDSSIDDYVVVTIKLPRTKRNRQLGTEVHSFSLRTNSWCNTKGTASHYHLGSGFSDGLFLNGALHWLVKSYDNLRIIIAFDVMEKRLSEIPMPLDLVIGLESKRYHLRAMGGYLCVYLRGKRSEIWMMKEYKVQSSWTKPFVLSTNFLYRPGLFFQIRFTKNEQGKLLELHTHGNEKGEFGVIDSIMYRESLLSLPEPNNSTKHRPKRVIKRPAGWDNFIQCS